VGPDQPKEESSAETPPGRLSGTVIRGAGLAGGGYVLAQTLNLAVYIVLSRLVTPAEFGAYAAATVLVGFSVLVTESGLQSALIHRSERLEEAQNTAVVSSIVGGLLAGGFVAAMAPLLGALFDSDDVTELALASSGLVLFYVLPIVPNALLQRRFSFLRMLVVDPVEVIVFGAVSIYAAANDMGAWALLIGQYAGLISSTILAWALARWRPRLRMASFSMWLELASYGRHIFVSTGILRIGEQAADTVIVGKLLGTAALGQYRYAFRVASMPFTVLLAAAAYVIFPAMARIAEDRDRLRAAFLRSLRWMTTLGIPAGLVLIPLGPPLTILVFGDVWSAAGYATIGMCAYAGAGAISSAVSELLKAAGRPDPLVRMHTVSTVVTASTMLAMVPLGLSAVATGLSIGAIAGALYALRMARTVVGVDGGAMRREIWPAVVAAAVMALVLLPVDRLLVEPVEHGTALGLLLVAAEGLAAIAIFVGALLLLAPHRRHEIGDLIRNRGARGDAAPAAAGSPGGEG
jgi:PST family polysaccharide transporter